MTQQSCIFCKIIAGAIPAKRIAENEHVIVIQDIAPKAPTHYLIIPRQHLPDINALQSQDSNLFGALGLMARHISQELMQGTDFRFVINNGPHAGQSVFHLHAHFLAGKKMSDL